MTPVLQWAARYPVRALAALQAVLAALTPVLPPGVSAALLAVLTAALGLGVHQAVTPVGVAAEQAALAASTAAELVARNLGPETVGLAGAVPASAGLVVDKAVAAVT
jgi:hypothetical protein